MYSRLIIWQSDPDLLTADETVFVNEFSIFNDAIDIRFSLKGYGYKPNFLDENVDVYYFGSYRCYYRKQGDTDWILFARPVSERAPSDDPFVYADIHVSTGLLDEDKYDIKIVAESAGEYSSWGGTLEGISAGDIFWFDLEARQLAPHKAVAYDNIQTTDVFYFGLDPFNLMVIDGYPIPVLVQDSIPTSSPLLGHLLNNFEAISLLDVLSIMKISYIFGIESLSVAEVVSFYSDLIQNHSAYDDVPIVEVYLSQLFPFYMFFYEPISVVEFIAVGVNPINLPTFYDDLDIEEYFESDGLPPWRIRGTTIDNPIIVDLSPSNLRPYYHYKPQQGMMRYEQVVKELCENFWLWTKFESGSGTISVDSGRYKFNFPASGYAEIKNTFTGIQVGVVQRDWQFLEFDLQFDNAYTGDQNFTIIFGRYVKFVLTYNHATTTLNIYGGQSSVNIVKDFANNNYRLRFEIMRNSSFGGWGRYNLSDIFVNNEFQHRLGIHDASYSSDGLVFFYGSNALASYWLDNILFGILRGEKNNDISLLIHEKVSDIDLDPISIAEFVSNAIVAKPPREPFVVDPTISISEYLSLTFDLVELPLIVQAISISDFLSINIFGSANGIDSITIIEEAIIELLAVGVHGQDYISMGESYSGGFYALLYDDTLVSLWNIQALEFVSITENRTMVVV